jgi:hypothetical protein
MKNDAEPRASPPAELVVEGVDKWFRTAHTTTHALDHVSFVSRAASSSVLLDRAAAANQRFSTLSPD